MLHRHNVEMDMTREHVANS